MDFDDPAGGRLPKPLPVEMASARSALASRVRRSYSPRRSPAASDSLYIFMPKYPGHLQERFRFSPWRASTGSRGRSWSRLRQVRPQFKSSRLRILDPSAAKSPALEQAGGATSPARDDRDSESRMDIHAFAWSEPGAGLEP